MYLNAALELNRDYRPEGFLGIIIEGPWAWRVCPATELIVDQGSGEQRITSRLVSILWRARSDLTFDSAVRSATGEEHINELHAGVTWTF